MPAVIGPVVKELLVITPVDILALVTAPELRKLADVISDAVNPRVEIPADVTLAAVRNPLSVATPAVSAPAEVTAPASSNPVTLPVFITRAPKADAVRRTWPMTTVLAVEPILTIPEDVPVPPSRCKSPPTLLDRVPAACPSK